MAFGSCSHDNASSDRGSTGSFAYMLPTGAESAGCVRCGVALKTRTIKRGGKYCSYECFQAARSALVELVDRVCEYCGRTFQARAEQVHNGQWKCCSKVCKDAITHKYPQRACVTCGKVYWPRSDLTDRGSGQFCSKPCAGIAKRNRTSCVCKRCGKAFEAKLSRLDTGRGIYCSKECQQPMLEKECEVCSAVFRTSDSELLRGWGRFCSLRCRSIERFGRPRVYVDRLCLVCGDEFQATEATIEDGGGKYCSIECRGINRRNRVTHACRSCGHNFAAAASRPDAMFCSRKCRTEWQRSDPEWQEHMVAMLRNILNLREPTRCEIVLYELMETIFGELWEKQYAIGFWTVDAAVPELQLVVQADGDFWHGLTIEHQVYAKVRGNMANDKRCDTYCEAHGWTVLRLWEHELLKAPDLCAERIRYVARV